MSPDRVIERMERFEPSHQPSSHSGPVSAASCVQMAISAVLAEAVETHQNVARNGPRQRLPHQVAPVDLSDVDMLGVTLLRVHSLARL